jgi:glycosyltransferase involved in cell wall biosynthesis
VRSADSEKRAFYGNAVALLFPIDWPEPFGLVVIEAIAYGTPVIAFRQGAVPEIIDHGVTGFAVDSVDEAVCGHFAGCGARSSSDPSAFRGQFLGRENGQRLARALPAKH